jgi:predicted hydrolase (HD superfamily)
MTPETARTLMEQWTENPALRVHMECVAACMGAYAEKYEPAERDRWLVAGLLHDMDYEKHPTKDEHPFVGTAHLREHTDVDEGIIEAILGHADYSGTPRTTPMAKCLYAVDELAGFIVACAKVRPNGISDLQPKSVKKKLKDKAFAAAVNRDEIKDGMEALAVDPTEHIQTCIDAIRVEAERLEL